MFNNCLPSNINLKHTSHNKIGKKLRGFFYYMNPQRFSTMSSLVLISCENFGYFNFRNEEMA